MIKSYKQYNNISTVNNLPSCIELIFKCNSYYLVNCSLREELLKNINGKILEEA
jgi:hypothetical protein